MISKRSIAIITIVFHILSLAAPHFVFAQGSRGSQTQRELSLNDNLDPDRAQEMLNAQDDADELNKELKEATEVLMEENLQISMHYVAYRAAEVLGNAYLKQRTSWVYLMRQWDGGEPLEMVEQAADAFGALDEEKRNKIQEVLKKRGFEGQLDGYIFAWLEKEEQSFGDNYWNELRSDGNPAQRCAKISDKVTEQNYAAVGFLVAMMALDIYTSASYGADKMKALIPLDEQAGEKPLFHNKQSSDFSKVFAGKYFSKFQKKIFKDENFHPFFQYGLSFASMARKPWYRGGYAQKALIKEATVIVEWKDHLAHHGSHHSTEKFARLKRYFSARDLGKTLRDTLKIAPNRAASGIARFAGAHAAHSVGSFMSSFVKGSVAAVVAEALVQSAIVVVAGQHKETVDFGDESVEVGSQRTTSQNDDSWLKERKFAFLDLAEEYADNAEAKIAGTVASVAVVALAGVSLPVTLIAAGVGYAVYEGVKYVTKSEWYQNWKNSNLIAKLKRYMDKMDYVTDRLSWNEEKREESAEYVAQWMMKRKEMAKQSPQRMYFVDRLSSIQIEKDGRYYQLKNGEDKYGETFDMEAHMRYDFFDVKGYIGVWDMHTPEKMHQVGKGKDINGLDVAFITPDSTMDFRDGQRVLMSKDGSNFRLLTNGTIWSKRDDDREKWIVKGITNKTDVVIRTGKGRFSYDPDRGGMVYVSESKEITPHNERNGNTQEDSSASDETLMSVAPPAAEKPNMSVDPLMSSEEPLSSEQDPLHDAFGVAP